RDHSMGGVLPVASSERSSGAPVGPAPDSASPDLHRTARPGRASAQRGRVAPPDIAGPTPPPDNVMGGTLVTRRGDIATVCHQRPAHDSSQPQPAERGGPSGTGPSQPIRPKARPDR